MSQDTERQPPRWRGKLFVVVLLLVGAAVAVRIHRAGGESLQKIAPFVTEAGTCFLIGLVLGKVSRGVLKIVLFALVLGFVVLQVLTYKQVIDVHWAALGHIFHVTPNGDLMTILQEKIPSIGAFFLGYVLGLARS